MLLLALDTATPATTVAVVRDGDVLAEETHVDARRHAEVLAPLIRSACTVASTPLSTFDAVVAGVGPGAYTGLRVGLVTAQALGHALGVPVHGVVTLDAMAFSSGLDEPFGVVADARRKELFWCRYDDPLRRVSGPEVGPPDDVCDLLAGLPVVGAGGTPFAGRFPDVRQPQLPSAAGLGMLACRRIAAGEPLGPPDPLYLRRPDVTVPAGPKPVSPR